MIHLNTNNYKKEILDKICFTELVYGRINKKLNKKLSKDKIEELISAIILETDESEFQKTGKNIYITNNERNVRLTINSFTNRIITADKLTTKQRKPNSTYKKLAVQLLNLPVRQAGETLCFISSFVVADTYVLRNRQLRQAPNRFAQA